MIGFIGIVLVCVLGFLICEARRLNRVKGEANNKSSLDATVSSVVLNHVKNTNDPLTKEMIYNIWVDLSMKGISATHQQIVAAVKMELVSAFESNLTFEMNSAFAA